MASLDPEQPEFLPDALESGTINTVGAASISAGIDFVKSMGTDNIFVHESILCKNLISELKKMRNVTVYRTAGANYLPIVLFNVGGYSPEETAAFLNSRGFALRAGLHCSGLAHKTIGTLPDGAVRFAPSVFNNAEEVKRLSAAIRELSEKK